MSDAIGKGTAQGAIEYLDSLVEKGRSRPGVISPLKTALKKILERTEGERWPDTDISSIDVPDTMARFKNLTLGNYSDGSYRTYELRVLKAIDWYRTFLDNPGWSPQESQRSISLQDKTKTEKVDEPLPSVGKPATPQAVLSQPNTPDMVVYPFPTSSGVMAQLHLPKVMSVDDAARLSKFLEALVVQAAPTTDSGTTDDTSP